MNVRSLGFICPCLSLLLLAPACSDDATSEGGMSMSSSEESGSTSDTDPTGEETASSGEESASASASSGDGDGDMSGDGDGDPATGDGDGDATGDGDGDATGDGDGDTTGDGDGDTTGDGDGDMTGDGDGDMSGDGDGDGDMTGDGDGDMSGDGDGDGDGDTGEDPCLLDEAVLEPVPPSVMLLLDRSGSMMTDDFDLDDPDKTRWQALYEAVELMVGDGADESIAFGAKTYSTKGTGACGVSDPPDVEIMLLNAMGILDGIPGPMEVVNGGTPTNLALDKTMLIMENFDAGGGAKVIVFITDGAIGCVDDKPQGLLDAVATLEGGLMDHDITTYVVGIAPSNWAEDELQDMAVAGGAPKPGPEAFYRADDNEALNEALKTVASESYAKSCVMNLDQAPFFPDETKVLIGNTEYELVNDCDNEDGFVYTNMDFTQIEVCGLACEELGNVGEATIQFYCDPG